MSLPGYDARYRAESERGEHGRPDRERRWRGSATGFGRIINGRIIVWVRRMAMCAVVRICSASARVHFASSASEWFNVAC